MSKNIISVQKEAVTIPPDNFETAEIVTKRTSVRLNNSSKNKSSKRETLNGPVIWFDIDKLSDQRPDDIIFITVINSFYSGIILYLNNISAFIDAIPKIMQIILRVKTSEELIKFRESEYLALFKFLDTNQNKYIYSNDIITLRKFKEEDIAISAGASGLCIGRNVFQNLNPQSLLKNLYECINAELISLA
ncbi:hypothetical protein LGZ99_12830 [Photorhabdus temperata]|uniref:hypothetical protein n=1 Tax=Photorhabdus temperata TaxID=574560 RepID=UPI0021D4AD59|nr:hypothetical protein [Photorhabdus temperata]MCT8348062.1 hypothetical protein [Photorhabdus temperata]